MPEMTALSTTVAARRLAAAVLALGLMAGFAGMIRSADATQQADTIAVGDEAPDFTLQSIDGETYRLTDVLGEKAMVIIFFRGTW